MQRGKRRGFCLQNGACAFQPTNLMIHALNIILISLYILALACSPGFQNLQIRASLKLRGKGRGNWILPVGEQTNYLYIWEDEYLQLSWTSSNFIPLSWRIFLRKNVEKTLPSSPRRRKLQEKNRCLKDGSPFPFLFFLLIYYPNKDIFKFFVFKNN